MKEIVKTTNIKDIKEYEYLTEIDECTSIIKHIMKEMQTHDNNYTDNFIAHLNPLIMRSDFDDGIVFLEKNEQPEMEKTNQLLYDLKMLVHELKFLSYYIEEVRGKQMRNLRAIKL